MSELLKVIPALTLIFGSRFFPKNILDLTNAWVPSKLLSCPQSICLLPFCRTHVSMDLLGSFAKRQKVKRNKS